MEIAMTHEFDPARRRLVKLTATALSAAAGLAVPVRLITPAFAAPKGKASAGKKKEEATKKEEVTPPEDLMREHGVLDRVLLIYEATIRRFSANDDFDPAVVSRSAEIIRDFINNYHEKSEEEYVFPRFKSAGKLVDLVDTLLSQHQAGRRVTELILRFAPTSRQNADDRRQLVAAMQSFITMYRPHAAREDTDVFPMLKDLVSPNEYDAMAEEFEKKEHQLFGEDGFEKMVQRVAGLEQAIGIHDLNQFTPRQ
jgi:hemerythrin-like domain-containing protein